MVCHCLLIEVGDGLVLVDTGLGLEDIARASERLSRAFRWAVRPALDPAETAASQVEALGFRRDDVRHIVLTHLDPDHAGGISDFPDATVHVMQAEHRGALTRERAIERSRYRPPQWAHGPRWELHDVRGEPWHGFEAVRDLPGLPPELLLVPLGGHTRGHAGVAVAVADGWLLHCGDAYFHRNTLEGGPLPLGLRCFQAVNQMDRKSRVENQLRLGELAQDHGDQVEVFCAHDASEFQSLSGVPSNENTRTE